MDDHLVNRNQNRERIHGLELSLLDMGCNDCLLFLSATQVSVFQSLAVTKVEVLPGSTKK